MFLKGGFTARPISRECIMVLNGALEEQEELALMSVDGIQSVYGTDENPLPAFIFGDDDDYEDEDDDFDDDDDYEDEDDEDDDDDDDYDDDELDDDDEDDDDEDDDFDDEDDDYDDEDDVDYDDFEE
jgi:hypothetical protein